MKAVYASIFKLDSSRAVKIGALGEISFDPGYYVYVGSAMNSVEKRLERHFSGVENKHWHIDYFSSEAEPVDYFILPEGSSEYECELASIFNSFASEVESFGSSDCSCDSHLFKIDMGKV